MGSAEPLSYVCLDCDSAFEQPHETCPNCNEKMSPDAVMPKGTRYGSFKVLTDCKHCGNAMPLNGPVLSVQCPSCNKGTQLGADIWKAIIEDLLEDYGDFKWGSTREMTILTDGFNLKVEHAQAIPHCGACSKAMPHTIAPGTNFSGRCRNCEALVSSYPPPQWLRDIFPDALQVYANEGGPEAPSAPELTLGDAPTPIVMQCPQCSGTLKVTQSSDRVLRCEYCSTDVYLPDALWNRLHPVKVVRRWQIRFAPAKTVSATDTDAQDLSAERSTMSDTPDALPEAPMTTPGGTFRLLPIILFLIAAIAALLGFLATR